MPRVTKAVVDVGSNSVLLLVESFVEGKWRTDLETSSVTGLGRGTKTSGLLARDSIQATLAALKEAFAEARSAGANEIAAYGTMALRIALNAEEFLEAAAAQGTPVSVLSGEQEAELGFLAVADDPLFADVTDLAIIDPGGHSTELQVARRVKLGWNVLFQQSFAVGALGLRESVLQDASPPPSARLSAAIEIDEVISTVPQEGGLTAVCLGATGTNLITIREKILFWDAARVHGQRLDYEEVSRAVSWMMDMDDSGRAAIPGIELGRERTLHIGCLILERFLYALRAESCVVSARGWRHAVLETELRPARLFE